MGARFCTALVMTAASILPAFSAHALIARSTAAELPMSSAVQCNRSDAVRVPSPSSSMSAAKTRAPASRQNACGFDPRYVDTGYRQICPHPDLSGEFDRVQGIGAYRLD